MQETQAEALITSEQSCFAEIFCLVLAKAAKVLKELYIERLD